METGQIDQLGEESVCQRMANFQSPMGVAAMRVENTSEKEEYELLYNQISSYWQEKVLKEERTQKEHKY